MVNKLVIISSYPEKGKIHGENTVGVASYTKNTLLAIKKLKKNVKLTVLAEIIDRKKSYKERGIEVKRIWKRNNISSLWRISKEAYKDIDNIVVIPFEANMFGSYIHTAIMTLFFLIWKIFNRKTIVILHQVVSDINSLEKNFFKNIIVRLFKNIFYYSVVHLAFRVVVFEDEFKQRLGGKPNIYVIPHAVENMRLINKRKARKILKINQKVRTILYFGYLSPYKGVDKLINIWRNKRLTKLIIAGGINPNHKNDHEYQKYIQDILAKINQKGIFYSGFIPEKKIPLYFSACDLVILPYVSLFSSSGPLSLAFAAEKPVLLSNVLEGYTKTADFKENMESSEIKKNDVLFSLNKNVLSRHLEQISQYENKLKIFSRKMKNSRSWLNTGKMYINLFSYV